MSSSSLLIYGATGYTGQLVARACAQRGLRPVLSGRNGARLERLGGELGLEHRVATLEQRELDRALRGIAVVLNAAGPFSATAHSIADASLRHGAHYLDLSAEIDAIEFIRARHAEACDHGVMLMSGVGFDVVPSDCLAAHVARLLPQARRLSIAVSGLALMSRGSARTMVEQIAKPARIRRAGEIVSVDAAPERRFDFGLGERACTAVGWADVATAYYTTGVSDITVYFEATPAVAATVTAGRRLRWLWGLSAWQVCMKTALAAFPEGPSDEQRAARSAVIVAEIEDASGGRVASRLYTPEAYTTTADAASEVARRVMNGDFEPGFHTPARVFGPDFVLSLSDIHREDIDA